MDDKITITRQELLANYNSADESGKKLLRCIYGDKLPKSSGRINSYEDIKSVEDAIEGLGFGRNLHNKLHSEEFKAFMPDFFLASDTEFLREIANHIIIVRALNKDYITGQLWMPDYNNTNQIKWEPRFDMRNGSGFGFSDSYCDDWLTDTAAGSRFVFRERPIMEHAVKYFLPNYKIIKH